jgi:hypothetical protein
MTGLSLFQAVMLAGINRRSVPVAEFFPVVIGRRLEAHSRKMGGGSKILARIKTDVRGGGFLVLFTIEQSGLAERGATSLRKMNKRANRAVPPDPGINDAQVSPAKNKYVKSVFCPFDLRADGRARTGSQLTAQPTRQETRHRSVWRVTPLEPHASFSTAAQRYRWHYRLVQHEPNRCRRSEAFPLGRSLSVGWKPFRRVEAFPSG